MPEPTENTTITKIKTLTQMVGMIYPVAGAVVSEIVTLIATLPGVTPETAAQLNAEIRDAQASIKMF